MNNQIINHINHYTTHHFNHHVATLPFKFKYNIPTHFSFSNTNNFSYSIHTIHINHNDFSINPFFSNDFFYFNQLVDEQFIKNNIQPSEINIIIPIQPKLTIHHHDHSSSIHYSFFHDIQFMNNIS